MPSNSIGTSNLDPVLKILNFLQLNSRPNQHALGAHAKPAEIGLILQLAIHRGLRPGARAENIFSVLLGFDAEKIEQFLKALDYIQSSPVYSLDEFMWLLSVFQKGHSRNLAHALVIWELYSSDSKQGLVYFQKVINSTNSEDMLSLLLWFRELHLLNPKVCIALHPQPKVSELKSAVRWLQNHSALIGDNGQSNLEAVVNHEDPGRVASFLILLNEPKHKHLLTPRVYNIIKTRTHFSAINLSLTALLYSPLIYLLHANNLEAILTHRYPDILSHALNYLVAHDVATLKQRSAQIMFNELITNINYLTLPVLKQIRKHVAYFGTLEEEQYVQIRAVSIKNIEKYVHAVIADACMRYLKQECHFACHTQAEVVNFVQEVTPIISDLKTYGIRILKDKIREECMRILACLYPLNLCELFFDSFIWETPLDFYYFQEQIQVSKGYADFLRTVGFFSIRQNSLALKAIQKQPDSDENHSDHTNAISG